jgi:hypothetical protein
MLDDDYHAYILVASSGASMHFSGAPMHRHPIRAKGMRIFIAGC